VPLGKRELVCGAYELERRCEEARKAEIEPLRKDAIERCVKLLEEDDPDVSNKHADCEQLYRDYGEVGHITTDGREERLFNNLPECLEFYDAERKSK